MTCEDTLVCYNNEPYVYTRDALEGKGFQRLFQKLLDRRLEEVAEAVGGGYCRLQMALGVRGTVAGRRLGTLEGGRGVPPPMHPCSTQVFQIKLTPWFFGMFGAEGPCQALENCIDLQRGGGIAEVCEGLQTQQTKACGGCGRDQGRGLRRLSNPLQHLHSAPTLVHHRGFDPPELRKTVTRIFLRGSDEDELA